MTIIVNADFFRAASIVQSTEETRYYLGGVYIEPHAVEGATLVATDGHRLVCVHDPKAIVTAPAIVQLPAPLLKATKRTGKDARNERQSRLVCVNDAGIPSIATAATDNDSPSHVAADPIALGVADCRIDGPFPDWRRVCPDHHGQEVANSPSGAGFDPAYLGAFAAVGEALAAGSGLSCKFISLFGADYGSPHIVRFHFEGAFGVIMPARFPHTMSELPGFMRAHPKATKAQAA